MLCSFRSDANGSSADAFSDATAQQNTAAASTATAHREQVQLQSMM